MRNAPSPRANSVWLALDELGDRATLLIVECCFLGVHRFDDFLKRTGVPRSMLTHRLHKLVDDDILARRLYRERPKRHEYFLTEKGRDLYGVALTMLEWERKWGGTAGQISVTLSHTTCGQRSEPELHCGHCKRVVEAREVTFADGPGAARMASQYGRRRRQSKAAETKNNPTTLMEEAIGFLGDRWGSMVAGACFLGLHRYEDIRAAIGISTNILADRLKRLVARGFLERQQYQTGPARYLYALTEKGLDFYPVLVVLMRWGDRWCGAGNGPPLVLTHEPCGRELAPILVCSACDGQIATDEVEYVVEPSVGSAKNQPNSVAGRFLK